MSKDSLNELSISFLEKIDDETNGLPITLVVPKIILMAIEYFNLVYEKGVKDGESGKQTGG